MIMDDDGDEYYVMAQGRCKACYYYLCNNRTFATTTKYLNKKLQLVPGTG